MMLVLAACEKEEKPYQLPPPGPSVVAQVSMGGDYSKVIFYNLNDNSFSVEELADWDLALESSPEGYRALMNGGAGVQCAPMGDTSFEALYNVDDAEWRWDPPSFNLDSTAIGEWSDKQFAPSREVYLLDRGLNTKHEQYKKLQLLEVTDSYFILRTASLDGSNDVQIRVDKDPNVNFVYVHLDKGALDRYEPNKEAWDFMFTRYRYVYYNFEPYIPYEVNGVVLNPNRVTVAETRMDYDSVSLEVASELEFTTRRDFIGFDWKFYDFDKEAYITDVKRIIVLKSHSGIYYKIRFIDFYDENGVKGAPSFEFQRL
ncbi:MAG: HmuY family protein [Bacteroidota bacterium]|nr:HmuY family protein [Bacteroidota bacterium]MDX5430434.1 HmuY family protein [Bacteroidota bacterium]MDX5469193.1 HmuY family protein [Bacteroidota bacterium]